MADSMVELKFTSQKPNTEPSGDAVPIGIATEPEVSEEATELVEEMAATTAINEIFEAFVTFLQDSFEDLKYTSEESNPVRTHLQIVNVEEEVVSEAYAIQRKLIDMLAKRGEEIAEKGGLLRTQVIDEEN